MTSISFICITIASLLLFFFITHKNTTVLGVSMAWLAVTGVLAANGFFEDTAARPPRFLLVPVVALILSVFCYKKLSAYTKNEYLLLGIHIIRIPVELVLYALFVEGLVPKMMTFTGYNYDILVGISALLLLCLSLRWQLPRLLLIVWNVAGLIFLATIVTIAVLASPLPVQQFAFDQPNVAVLKFPFIFLPAFVVPVVALSHAFALRQLLAGKN